MSKEILRPVFAGMGLLASLALIGCGGGSGQTRPGGTGGTTGAGGTSSSTGGSSATGGTGGSASGTGGAPMALACTANPTNQLLSNFNLADSGDGGINSSGQWGTAGMLTGHTFGYSGTMTNDAGVTSKVSSSIDTGKMELVLAGTVNAADFAGGGMSFDTCVNTTNWTGVQFTLGGTADGCHVTFMLQTESQEPPTNKGTCTASSCYQFPQLMVTIPTDGSPTVVHFTDLDGTGMPTGHADFEKEMFGLQWQFTSAAPPDGSAQVGCKPNMTISDVMWTTN